MAIARSRQIDLSVTPYYHCVNRCVRRAFLCGEDAHSGKSYKHRRGWIENKIIELSALFAIDVAAYAVMSNHYHVVLRVDQERAESWSNREVVRRWQSLFKLPYIINRFIREENEMSQAELSVVSEIVEEWRERLYDISWFMRLLNEQIARQANKEDDVTGRFWEGRFKSQALLDEQALIACMAYVDLNPVRATMAKTPEHSDFTSIQRRLRKAMKATEKLPSGLMPFQDEVDSDLANTAIPFERNDYLSLVDWSGRAIRDNKRGSIPDSTPPILYRLGIDNKLTGQP